MEPRDCELYAPALDEQIAALKQEEEDLRVSASELFKLRDVYQKQGTEMLRQARDKAEERSELMLARFRELSPS